jgi:hypothetical protein
MQAGKNAVEKTMATLGGKVHGGGQPGVGSQPVGTGTGKGQSIGDQLMSAIPGHGSGQPGVGTGTGQPTGNYPISDKPGQGTGQHVVGSHPTGTGGTGRTDETY